MPEKFHRQEQAHQGSLLFVVPALVFLVRDSKSAGDNFE